MRALLRAMPSGVPLDTLLARVRGRRSFLIDDWDRLLLAPEPLAGLPPAPWRPAPLAAGGARPALQREQTWVFGGLTERVRETVAPLFWLFEVRTLAICLRCLDSDRGTSDLLLRESLLADPIRTLLGTAPDTATAVRQLAKQLVPRFPTATSLPKHFARGGCGAVEATLYDLALAQSVATAADPIVRRTLALLIDSRNLIAVAKQLRWRLPGCPPLLPGGSIVPKILETHCLRQDTATITRLASRLDGGHQPGGEDEIEQTVLAATGRFLRRQDRESGGIATIIDYLWRCSAEARNLGLLARQATAGSSLIAAEMLL